MQPLLTALDLARRLYTGDLKAVPDGAPLQFVPAAWRRALWQESGQLDRQVWELALAFAVRDALRAGDLYLAESRHHVSFWNLVYDETRWQEERHQTYVTLQLPSDADRALAQLHTDFAQVAAAAAQGLARNPFATIVDGRLHLKRRDALEVSAQVRALRRVMETHLPRVRIEDLLREVDTWCHFTRALRPLVGAPPLAVRFYPTLLAALVAHGTNLGIALMGESTDGITVDMLHEVSHACLRTDTLKAANTALVDYHHRLASRLFFANQGVFRTGDYEEIMSKVSCLSLLSNAVLVWNTVRMTEILAQLRAAGETIPAEDLARVSPLAYAHVIPNGTYHFDRPLATGEEMSQALA